MVQDDDDDGDDDKNKTKTQRIEAIKSHIFSTNHELNDFQNAHTHTQTHSHTQIRPSSGKLNRRSWDDDEADGYIMI